MSNIDKLTDKYYKYCIAIKYGIDPESEEYKFLLKIDTSPHHYMAISNMSLEELDLADKLARKRWIELVPASHGVTQKSHYDARVHVPSKQHLPARYVMLSGGSYALGTFDMDTSDEEGF